MLNNQLRTALGTRDFCYSEVENRNKIFEILKEQFKLRGGVELDTPVIELYDLIDDLYGNEFNKLVYKFNTYDSENNTEQLFLRYDLTVPLARFIAMNGKRNFRRYQIGKVYRKDKPQMTKGRLREFYQVDFDIVSDNMSQTQEIEILDLLDSCLMKLIGQKYYININDKNILREILESCDIIVKDFDKYYSIIDSLDKNSWSEILKEERDNEKTLIRIKKIIDSTLEFTTNQERIQYLYDTSCISKKSYDDMKSIFELLKLIDIENKFRFDPTLARGMNYYTGIIYEAKFNDQKISKSTIAAGGRYDNMIDKFSNVKGLKAIGMSIGVDRILAILKESDENKEVNNNNNYDAYIASIGDSEEVYREKLRLCCELRKLKLRTMISDRGTKIKRQYNDVMTENIPLMIFIGGSELASGKYKIKNMKTKIEEICDKDTIGEYITIKIRVINETMYY